MSERLYLSIDVPDGTAASVRMAMDRRRRPNLVAAIEVDVEETILSAADDRRAMLDRLDVEPYPISVRLCRDRAKGQKAA